MWLFIFYIWEKIEIDKLSDLFEVIGIVISLEFKFILV